MKRTHALWLTATLNAACAALAMWSAARIYSSSQQQENAGVAVVAVVLALAGLIALAVAIASAALAARPRGPSWRPVAVFLAGLGPPIAFAPFLWDELERGRTTLELACSNLHRNDPQREVAIFTTYHTYFALLHPWIEHQENTRYRLESGTGEVVEFRLRCAPNGPCTMKDGTEAELRAAVARLLPPCPPPRD